MGGWVILASCSGDNLYPQIEELLKILRCSGSVDLDQEPALFIADSQDNEE
jgi:hypothetical protein